MEEGTLVAGRYEVQRRLAQGGMAVVLAAHDRRLRRDVALKVARRGDATDRVRFGAEMRLLASLQHPHLVRVFDAGVHQGEAYLVLELADGPTLGQLLGAGPIEEERLVDLGRDIAGALGHLHDRGIIHRDVKPANVLTNADGRWLLADLGIARLVDDTGVTDTGLAVGTPAYLAPEQVAGGCAEPATDVCALGQVLLEAATAQPAFPGGGVEAARARLTQDPDVSAAPVAWQGLLAAMTARDPGDRPSAAEVHERLADVASAVPPVAATGPGTPVLLSTGPVVAPAARHEGAGVDELDALAGRRGHREPPDRSARRGYDRRGAARRRPQGAPPSRSSPGRRGRHRRRARARRAGVAAPRIRRRHRLVADVHHVVEPGPLDHARRRRRRHPLDRGGGGRRAGDDHRGTDHDDDGGHHPAPDDHDHVGRGGARGFAGRRLSGDADDGGGDRARRRRG